MTRHRIPVARLRQMAREGLHAAEIDRRLGVYNGYAAKTARRLGIKLCHGHHTRTVPAWASWEPAAALVMDRYEYAMALAQAALAAEIAAARREAATAPLYRTGTWV
ncbi:MAG TPA: hypothetical protein VGH36_04470 [Acetobacteraceae bacterium]